MSDQRPDNQMTITLLSPATVCLGYWKMSIFRKLYVMIWLQNIKTYRVCWTRLKTMKSILLLWDESVLVSPHFSMHYWGAMSFLPVLYTVKRARWIEADGSPMIAEVFY